MTSDVMASDVITEDRNPSNPDVMSSYPGVKIITSYPGVKIIVEKLQRGLVMLGSRNGLDTTTALTYDFIRRIYNEFQHHATTVGKDSHDDVTIPVTMTSHYDVTNPVRKDSHDNVTNPVTMTSHDDVTNPVTMTSHTEGGVSQLFAEVGH